MLFQAEVMALRETLLCAIQIPSKLTTILQDIGKLLPEIMNYTFDHIYLSRSYYGPVSPDFWDHPGPLILWTHPDLPRLAVSGPICPPLLFSNYNIHLFVIIIFQM